MGASGRKSRAIYSLVKGLEAKLNIITAALEDNDQEFVISTEGGGNSRVEAWKTKKGETIKWTEEKLYEECGKNHDLFGALVAFVLRLKGQEVPDHLRNI